MAIDPRQLRPGELIRLLNSTPLGEVASDRQLYRHRQRAGLFIGDGERVDLFRYVAWLVQERHKPRPLPDTDPYSAVAGAAKLVLIESDLARILQGWLAENIR